MIQVVTGDSQEEVIIFRYRQTELHHNIYIVVIILDLSRLPEARVQELAADLVAALHYLHSNRILHRWALLHKMGCDRSIRS